MGQKLLDIFYIRINTKKYKYIEFIQEFSRRERIPKAYEYNIPLPQFKSLFRIEKHLDYIVKCVLDEFDIELLK